MKNRLMQLFNLKTSEETTLLLVLGIVLLSNSLAMQVSGIVSISGFLSSGGVNQILLVLLVDYIIILAIGGVQTMIVDKYNRVKLLGWISLGFSAVFLLLRLMFWLQAPEWLNYSLMYLVAEQQFVLFPLVFWVLANDIFRIAQAKRIFPLVSGGNFIGKLIGIGIAAFSPTFFQSFGIKDEEILIFNAFVYLFAYSVLIFGLRKKKVENRLQKTESFKETLSKSLDFAMNVPSFKYIMYSIFALAFVDTIIEFRFLLVTDQAYPDQASYQQFYSMYRFGTTIISLAVQAFITSRLIKAMQLKNSLLIFPLVTLGSAISMMLLPGFSVAVISMLTLKIIRETVNDSSRKNLQGLVPEENSGRVSTLMESYLPAGGTIAACIAAGVIVSIGAWQNRDYYLAYLGISAIGAVSALWAILKMRRVYDVSLLNWRLRRKKLGRNTIIRKLSYDE